MAGPSPPFVSVAGIHNLRDIGGYPISQPGTDRSRRSFVRCGQLYRSAEPSQVTADGLSALRALDIATVFDLRSGPEIEKARHRAPVVDLPGSQRVFAPVFTDQDYSPEHIALRYRDYASSDGTEGFRRAYLEILSSAGPAYRKILLHLAGPDPSAASSSSQMASPQTSTPALVRPRPCLIHCTAGKDRTGLLVALILALCGVDDDTIAREYQLTEIGLADWIPAVIEHLLQHPALEGNRQGAINMVSARAENMQVTLEMIRDRWGGAEGYMKLECGLSDDEIHRIRRNMTVSADDDDGPAYESRESELRAVILRANPTL